MAKKNTSKSKPAAKKQAQKPAKVFTEKLTKIIPNPSNPRIIRDEKYEKLKSSLKEFPEMLEARPIVVDEKMIVLGGNMRLKALTELGVKEVKVMQVFGWSEDQKNQFVIKDNNSFGEWDWDILANEWDSKRLEEWGLDVWQDNDVSGLFLPGDEDDDDTEVLKTLSVKFTPETYDKVIDALEKIDKNHETAILKAFNIKT